MNHSDAKLSICIPTYNRAKLLGQTLDNIIREATPGLEIVVSDNASTDETCELVNSYRRKYPRITYLKQPTNIGQEPNYLEVVKAAQGEYCWLMGDDDQIVPGGIKYILDNYLNKTRHIDFLLLTLFEYDETLTYVRNIHANHLGKTEDIYTNNVKGFLAEFFCSSYLSTYIVNRKKWLRVDARKYLNLGVIYQCIVYDYLAREDSYVQYVAKPVVKYRSGNATWRKDTLELQLAKIPEALSLLPEGYDPVKQYARERYFRLMPVTLKMLVSLRADGAYDRRQYDDIICPYLRESRIKRVLAGIIVRIPVNLAVALRYVYKLLKPSNWSKRGHVCLLEITFFG